MPDNDQDRLRAKPLGRMLITPEVGPPPVLVNPELVPAVRLDPEAVRLVEELSGYKAPMVPMVPRITPEVVGLPDGVSSQEALMALEELARHSVDPAPLPLGEKDQQRFMRISVVVPTYGTADQAQETAKRVRRMLSVELHQPVILAHEPRTTGVRWVQHMARRNLCSCYDVENIEQGPVTDPDCAVHG